MKEDPYNMTGAFLTGFNGAGNNNSKLFSGSGEGKSINTVATNVASFPQSSTTSTVGPKLQNHLFTPTTDTRNDNLMKLSEVVPQFNTNHRQSDGTVGQGAVNNDMPATVMLQEILRRLSHSNMNTTPATDIKNNNNGTGAGAGGVSNSSSGTNNFVSYPTSKTSSPPPFTNQHLRSMSIGGSTLEKINNEYLVEKTLGEGAFGKVKLATHILTNQKVAIKCLEKSSINKSVGTAERVLREIVLLSHLNHPNICKLLQVIDTPLTIYLVMEHQAGGELFEYLVKSKRLTEDVARFLFRQMLSAIQYCHSHGVVHRDLKPENVLLDEYGNVKIIDFGFANIMRENTLLETFCGSAAYAAPEMIGGKKYIGSQIDAWAFGVILFVVVCGQMPFDDRNMSRMFIAIMSGKYTFPDFVSAEFKDLVSKILKTKPTERATLEDMRQHPWTNDNGRLPTIHFCNASKSNNNSTSNIASEDVNNTMKQRDDDMGEQKKPLQSAQQQPGHAETFNAAIFNNYNNNIMKNNNSGNLNHRCSFCQSASCVSEQDMQTIRERLVGGLGYGVEEVSMALEKQYPSSVYCAFHILLKQQTSINVDWLSKLGLMDESLLGKIISGFPSASSSSTTALTTTTTIEVPRSSVTIKQQGSGGSSSNYAAAAALITGVGGWAQPGKARSSITTTMTASAMVVIPSNTTTTSSSSSGNSCDMEMNDVDDDIDEDYVEQQWQRKRQSSNRSNLQHMIVEGEEESDCDEMSSSIDALSLSSRSIGGSVGSIAYRKSLASRRKNLELIANSLLKKM